MFLKWAKNSKVGVLKRKNGCWFIQILCEMGLDRSRFVEKKRGDL